MRQKSLTIQGVEWEYETAGRGEEALLLFHGAVGGGETMRGLAEAFAGEFRTIAPTVADVDTLAEVCDAASAILDREHVARAHVFGGSFGGLVAQAFVHRRPAQVSTLTLLSTGAPDRRAGGRAERAYRLARLVPFPVTRALLKFGVARQLRPPADGEAAERFEGFRGRLDEYLDRRLTKRTMLSRLALGLDFNLRESYAAEDLEAWPGRVLIVESDDDPLITDEDRRRLRSLYRGALVCAFPGAGHLVQLVRPEGLTEVVRAFVKEEYAAPSDIEDHCPADGHHAHQHPTHD
jgi:pimeloyl-ACP methyl ester carboxylesterase